MAKVSQVFQDTFQTNVFQKAWGDVVFDRNVFQPNVFDVVQAIVKLVNESYGITESKETARVLISALTEDVGIESFRKRVRALIHFATETLGYTESTPFVRSILKAFEETLGTTEGYEKLKVMASYLEESVGSTETKKSSRVLQRFITTTVGSVENFTKKWTRVFTETVKVIIPQTFQTLFQSNVFQFISEAVTTLGKIRTHSTTIGLT